MLLVMGSEGLETSIRLEVETIGSPFTLFHIPSEARKGIGFGESASLEERRSVGNAFERRQCASKLCRQ